MLYTAIKFKTIKKYSRISSSRKNCVTIYQIYHMKAATWFLNSTRFLEQS